MSIQKLKFYAKEYYSAEPDRFSFNEINCRAWVLFTLENHIKFIGVPGEKLERMGLKDMLFSG